MKKDLEDDLEEFFFNRLSCFPRSLNNVVNGELFLAPVGFLHRCAMGAVQALDALANQYITNKIDKDEFLEGMKESDLTPIQMSQVLEWAESEKENKDVNR